MKKMFLLFAATVLFTTLQAQTRIGARGGLTISTINGQDISDYKFKAGFYLGALAQIPVFGNFSVQPELNYSAQGAKWEDEGNTSLGYVQLPVLATYKTASGFFAETGPQLGFLVKAKDSYDGDKQDIKEYLKKTEFAWVFGAGYQVTENIAVQARYQLALSELYDNEKNSVFHIGVQYTLNQLIK